MLIYKICRADEWQAACAKGRYCGSPDDLRDGFIHFSPAEQLAATADKHFAGQTSLVLVAFDTDALGPDLKWEPSRGGALFPHFYGEVDASLSVWVRPVPDGENAAALLQGETA